MRTMRAAGFVSVVVLVAGCVYSERGPSHPDGRDAVMDASLLGVWRARDHAWQDWRYYRLEPMGKNSNEYAFVFTSTDPGEKAPQRWPGIRLICLGEVFFLDAPNPLAQVPAADRPGGMGGRCICRLRRSGNRLAIDLLNARFVRAHPEAIPQVRWGPFKRFVRITATREELRAFLVANAHNETAWVKSAAYELEKVKTADAARKSEK